MGCAGNPEEGELRPQLLDRFGMHAEIRTVKDPSLRVQIVEQRAEFDADPAAFRSSYGATQQELTNKITAARKLLKEVRLYGLIMQEKPSRAEGLSARPELATVCPVWSDDDSCAPEGWGATGCASLSGLLSASFRTPCPHQGDRDGAIVHLPCTTTDGDG